MMANHRTLALTPFDPTHSTMHAHTRCTLAQLWTLSLYTLKRCTLRSKSNLYMFMYIYMYMYIAHSEQLLGQPITNENTSFVFEFGILALMSSALNFGKYRSIKARRRRLVTLYIVVHHTRVHVHVRVHAHEREHVWRERGGVLELGGTI